MTKLRPLDVPDELRFRRGILFVTAELIDALGKWRGFLAKLRRNGIYVSHRQYSFRCNTYTLLVHHKDLPEVTEGCYSPILEAVDDSTDSKEIKIKLLVDEIRSQQLYRIDDLIREWVLCW